MAFFAQVDRQFVGCLLCPGPRRPDWWANGALLAVHLQRSSMVQICRSISTTCSLADGALVETELASSLPIAAPSISMSAVCTQKPARVHKCKTLFSALPNCLALQDGACTALVNLIRQDTATRNGASLACTKSAARHACLCNVTKSLGMAMQSVLACSGASLVVSPLPSAADALFVLCISCSIQ